MQFNDFQADDSFHIIHTGSMKPEKSILLEIV